MIVITESWLHEGVQDAEITIPNYVLYRADRDSSRTHGGCAMWVRYDLSSQQVVSHSNAWVETLIVKVKTLDTLVMVNYRPPDCQTDKFNEALQICQKAVNSTMKEDSKVRTILDFGDYNFPCISWPSKRIYVNENKERTNQSEEKKQAEQYIKFQEENFMENHIETATRQKAILDLVSSNNLDLIQTYKITVNKKLSDHNTIELKLNFIFNEEVKLEKVKNPYLTKVFEYETEKATEEQKTRFEHLLDQYDEDKLDEMESTEEQLETVYNLIIEALRKSVDLKKEFEDKNEDETKEKPHNFIPKKIRQLMKRKRILSERMVKSKDWYKNFKVQLELEDVETELENHYKSRRKTEEKGAISKLFGDSKYIKYANKFSKTKGQLNGFVDKEGKFVNEPTEMSEILRKQYLSVASTPREEFAVNDAEYFFFFTSPDLQAPYPKFPSMENSDEVEIEDCVDCAEERVHVCKVDGEGGEEQDDGLRYDASREQWRLLLNSHVQRIEGEVRQVRARARFQVPGSELEDESESEETEHGYQMNTRVFHQTTINSENSTLKKVPNEQKRELFFSWEDFSSAIDSIPRGAAPGPDGISATVLKMAKKPIARMLCKIMKKSLSSGNIPSILKHSFIIPIHKGGSLSEPANFRPISLTSHIMKTMERVMRLSLINFLEYHKKLDPRQHGSRAQRSTLSQLLQHHDDILKALEDGDNLDCIYLDFSKAYDKVDHGILLHKLKQLGISGSIGRWIRNFLIERSQQVMVKGRKSEEFPLVSGVPQGSVLGPLLFLIFIGDISEGVTASILVYVDDSKVSNRIKTPEDVETLQDDLDKIFAWEKENNMKFNGGKFLILRYGKDNDLKENTIYFTGCMLYTSKFL